ncbi:hypothetical protein [Methanobrevibacter sp.]|uniref:hypothetical protein n=1 Tax=Methanobrevibacter sp. TaxID=66852 RepID=UPI0025D82850|nr:hypothetical protein [Methanobrevibacter sp.]
MKIYNMTENASPLGQFNCGELCNSICCTVENGEKNNVIAEMVLYLLPGEEEMLDNESDWFEIFYETTDEIEYPDSWKGNVYYIKCTNPPHCNRRLRPIQCRSFPLSPHLDKDDNLHLIYDEDDMTYQCPIISEKRDLDEDFLKKTYKMWKRLTEDKLIFDLVKMDSEKREKRKIDYKIVFSQ